METILLLHASTSSARQWRHLYETLATSFQLVSPDLLGYGGNPIPASTFTIADEVEHALSYLDDRQPFHLVGHSYGGLVALQIAQRCPERVLSMVLYEPTNFTPVRTIDPTAYATIRLVADETARLVANGRLQQAAATFIEFWVGAGAWRQMPPRVQQGIAATMEKVCLEWPGGFEAGLSTEEIAQLPMPSLLMYSNDSPIVARVATNILHRHLPHSQLIEMENIGHMGPVSAPTQVNPHIRSFLSQSVALAGQNV